METLLFGLGTTVVGMGIVFAVLAILWALLTLVARLDPGVVAAGPPDAPGLPDVPAAPAAVPAPRVVLEGDTAGLDPRLVAAITVAILRHAAARRLQAAPAMRSYWPGSLLFASRWVAAGRTRQGQSWHRRR